MSQNKMDLDRCPRTGFVIPSWIDHVTGLPPAQPPTKQQIRNREVDAYYDEGAGEKCAITQEVFGPDNPPFFYFNDQDTLQELHGYSANGLLGWLEHGGRRDPETGLQWGSPHEGIILPVYMGKPLPNRTPLQELQRQQPPQAVQARPPLYRQLFSILAHELWYGAVRWLTVSMGDAQFVALSIYLHNSELAGVYQLMDEIVGLRARRLTADFPPHLFTYLHECVMGREIIPPMPHALRLMTEAGALRQPPMEPFTNLNIRQLKNIVEELMGESPRIITLAVSAQGRADLVRYLKEGHLPRVVEEIMGQRVQHYTVGVSAALMATMRACLVSPHKRPLHDAIMAGMMGTIGSRARVTFVNGLRSVQSEDVLLQLDQILNDSPGILRGWTELDLQRFALLAHTVGPLPGFSRLGRPPPGLTHQAAVGAMKDVVFSLLAAFDWILEDMSATVLHILRKGAPDYYFIVVYDQERGLVGFTDAPMQL